MWSLIWNVQGTQTCSRQKLKLCDSIVQRHYSKQWPEPSISESRLFIFTDLPLNEITSECLFDSLTYHWDAASNCSSKVHSRKIFLYRFTMLCNQVSYSKLNPEIISATVSLMDEKKYFNCLELTLEIISRIKCYR